MKRSTGEPLTTLGAVDATTWLELGKGAKVALRHAVSGREVSIEGPALVMPCRAGREQVLLPRGVLKSSPGTGVRPGAELSVATPFGSARYGDADMVLAVTETEWSVAVRSGMVWTDPPIRVGGRPADGRVLAGQRGSSSGKPDPVALAARCDAIAAEARAGAEGVLSGGPKGLGERAAAQLVLRQRARAACSTAAAAVRREPDPEQQARLVDQIARADASWEAVPPPSPRGVPPQP